MPQRVAGGHQEVEEASPPQLRGEDQAAEVAPLRRGGDGRVIYRQQLPHEPLVIPPHCLLQAVEEDRLH